METKIYTAKRVELDEKSKIGGFGKVLAGIFPLEEKEIAKFDRVPYTKNSMDEIAKVAREVVAKRDTALASEIGDWAEKQKRYYTRAEAELYPLKIDLSDVSEAKREEIAKRIEEIGSRHIDFRMRSGGDSIEILYSKAYLEGENVKNVKENIRHNTAKNPFLRDTIKAIAETLGKDDVIEIVKTNGYKEAHTAGYVLGEYSIDDDARKLAGRESLTEAAAREVRRERQKEQRGSLTRKEMREVLDSVIGISEEEMIARRKSKVAEMMSEYEEKLGEALREFPKRLAETGDLRSLQRWVDTQYKNEYISRDVIATAGVFAAKFPEAANALKQAEEKLETFEAKLKESAETIEKQIEKIKAYEKTIGEQIETIEKLTQALKKANAGLEAKTKELEEAKREIGERDETIARLEKDLSAKEKELDAAKREIGEKEREIEKLEEGLTAKEKELEASKKDLEEREKTIDRLEKELAATEKKLSSAEKELGKKEKAIKGVEKRLASAEKELEEAKSEISEKDKEIERLQKELEEKAKELEKRSEAEEEKKPIKIRLEKKIDVKQKLKELEELEKSDKENENEQK